MNAVEQALSNTLAAGTALTSLLGGTAIYNSMAPKTATLPYVIFSYAGGAEENLTPTESQRLVYLVKGVASTLYQAGQIADEIKVLLHNQVLTVSGWTNFWTALETPIEYVETTPAGQRIGHAGGEYAIRIEKT